MSSIAVHFPEQLQNKGGQPMGEDRQFHEPAFPFNLFEKQALMTETKLKRKDIHRDTTLFGLEAYTTYFVHPPDIFKRVERSTICFN